jgi:hypothetical protein
VLVYTLDRSMTASTWQETLARASSPDEVLSVARVFVANFSHTELDQLPEPCQPRKLSNTHDLASYAYDLLCSNCDNEGPEVTETVRQLSTFFAEAAARLSELTAPKPPSPVRLFSNN